MPRDSNGIYTLPNGYLAVAGQTIQPSQHNPPLEDVAQALTNSLPRDGSAPMTSPLKLVDGTAALPGLAFNSTIGVGLFKSTNGIGFAVGGAQVAEIGASGFLGVVPVGALVPYIGSTAPASWLFPIGQNISRTTYATLWATMGSPNTGDGSTTFTMPDLRGRSIFGKDDMGGSAANRIQASTTITTSAGSAAATVGSAANIVLGMTVKSANVPDGITITAISGTNITLSTGTGVTAGSAVAARFSWLGDAQALGSAGGEQSHATTLPETAAHNHGGTTSTDSGHQHGYVAEFPTGNTAALGTGAGNGTFTSNANTQTSGVHAHTISSAGGGLAHNNLPPGVICNFIVYAGI